MKYSAHNIFSRIIDSENYFIVNILSGGADILEPSESRMIQDYIEGKTVPPEFVAKLSEKGYISDRDEEAKLYQKKYLEFLDARDNDEVQLFFVPNYSCNFACTYCYQDEYDNSGDELTTTTIDAFFNYVSSEFAARKKYVTVFGGEPLLNSPAQKKLMTYFLSRANDFELEVCVVTNAYYLEEYTEILKNSRIREVQVTLDGPAEMHNKRRFLKGGGDTFEKIVKGIDACLVIGLPLNLRVVIDKENIDGLTELAKFAIEKGWTTSPLFKTQLGRNYELHHCQADSDKLFSRISLYLEIYELTKKHPEIMEFHKPAYSITKFLYENGNLPDPLFDACPACKTEWAFDYTGKIYSCTATVGKTNEALGTYFPGTTKKDELISVWEDRDVTSIKECGDCSLRLACGGGCGSVAKNKTGSILSPDCRPVKELLELGFAAYFINE